MLTNPPVSNHIRSMKLATFAAVLAAVLSAIQAHAGDIESLKGQFTFDWLSNPGKAKCVAIDDQRLTHFKSQDFTCDLNPITNTVSGKPARVCTQISDTAEYLVFASRGDCEEERKTHAFNSEE